MKEGLEGERESITFVTEQCLDALPPHGRDAR
jgi:hypothetical protein